MNIVVPIAGKSKAFTRSKFKYPRYGIKIAGVTVLERSLRGIDEGNFYFVCLNEHLEKNNLGVLLSGWKASTVMSLNEMTRGQASTAMCAGEYINNDDPLLIISPAQLIHWDAQQFIECVEFHNVDAAVVVAEEIVVGERSFHVDIEYRADSILKGSHAKSISCDWEEGRLTDCGVYYFKYGWYFDKWCKKMMENSNLVDNEYWVAPCMNYGIFDGKWVLPYRVPSVALLDKPKDLRDFAKSLPKWASL